MANSVTLGGFSGFDSTSVVNQLVALEKQSLTKYTRAKDAAAARQTAWQTINSKLGAVNTAMLDVMSSARMYPTSITSSDTSRISVTGTPSSEFSAAVKVDQLASSEITAITGFASSAMTLATSRLTLTPGARAIGAESFTSTSTGQQQVQVQARSLAAKVTGLASGLTLGSPASFTVTTGTGTKTISIAAGTYADAAALAAATDAALRAAGADVRAAVEGGAVTLSTTGQGSAHTLTVGGPDAAALGLSTTTATGTDAVVSVDGTSVTLADLKAGSTVALGATGVSVVIGASGGLTIGQATLSTFAGTSLSEIQTQVNSAGLAVSAAVTGGATGGAQLLLTSRSTGQAAAVTAGWSGAVGTAEVLRSGADAKLRLGSQVITRGSNTVTDLLPGATLLLKQAGDTEISLTAAKDKDTATTKVKAMVDAVNNALAQIDFYAKPNPSDASKSGLLYGDSTLRSLRTQVASALSGSITTTGGVSTVKTLSSVGITVGRDGMFKFDETKFRTALESDATNVTSLLSRTAVATDTKVSYLAGTSDTSAGTYAVQVTQAASEAELAGWSFTTLAASESIEVKASGITFTYAAAAGLTPDQVAAGLNAAAASAGARIIADVSGGAVRIRTTDVGSARTLQLTGGWGTGLTGSASGTDVVGTINGAAATGSGRTLTSTTGAAKGLGLTINATQADVVSSGGDLGTVTFSTGFAASLGKLIDTARGSTGTVGSGIASVGKEITRAQAAIDKENLRLTSVENRIRKQYAALETVLARLNTTAPSSFDTGVSWKQQ